MHKKSNTGITEQEAIYYTNIIRSNMSPKSFRGMQWQEIVDKLLDLLNDINYVIEEVNKEGDKIGKKTKEYIQNTKNDIIRLLNNTRPFIK